MEIRPLTANDTEAVRHVATASLYASYSDVFGPATIDAAVREWYAPDAFAEYLENGEMLFLVAEADGAVVGFSQSSVDAAIDKGRILWIHVDPGSRGEGIANDLLEATIDALHYRGIGHVTALVLADHEEGNRFYRAHGFEKLFTRAVYIAGEQHLENVYGETGREPRALDRRVTADGTDVYVDFDEADRGSLAPFYAVYVAPDRTTRYGWFCSNCASLDTVMDSMGRIECRNCTNRRKPTRWDAAY